MEFLRFESNHLREHLEKLSPQARVAFALACSLRTAAGQPQAEPMVVAARELAEEYALNGSLEPAVAHKLLAQLWESPELDRDDAASAYYALESALKDNVESVIWAAQRAYDARDTEAQATLTFSIFTKEIEETLILHPAVQKELRSQLADIDTLLTSASNIRHVIHHARSEGPDGG